MKTTSILFVAVAFGLLFAPSSSRAEPYLAVRTGAKCGVCHVNPTGGGKRTEFGATFGQTALPENRLDLATGKAAAAGAEPAAWTGKLNEHFGLGADLRANARATFTPNTDTDAYAFDPVRSQIYLEVTPIANRLTIYLDERVSPGAATNRETYAMLWTADRSAYLKVGRMFVPFGLRIEDDTAFVRVASGTNFNAFDDGVEIGLETGPWSAQLAMTNGAGGGTETNRGKLVSALGSYVQPDWRIGVSASTNYNGGADRRMQNAFAGLRTGIVAWLASGLRITDDGTPTGRVEQRASLIEANFDAAKGHNLKLTYEWFDPNVDVDEDHRERFGVVWEVTPFQFTQFRAGVRKNHGIPQNDAQNATELFLQWHAFF